MKTLNKVLLFVGLTAAAAGFTSCVGDLDLTPTDPANTIPTQFADDPEGYMDKVMADCYLQFATTGYDGANGTAAVEGFDGGSGTFTRAVFNLMEIPTDEADWISATDSYLCASIQYSQFPVDNSAIYGTYSRLTINASVCSDFIRTVNEGMFRLPESSPDYARLQEKAAEYIRQAKILHSLAYFYLIDLFGNVPYIDWTMAPGSVPAQVNRADLYKKVVATLEQVVEEYGENYNVQYGYVGKEAAQALLVKFYLNAEVYTGTPAFDKCIALSKEIIARHQDGVYGNGLAETYACLFAANNHEYCAGGARENEILWAIPQSDEYLTSWAGTTVLLAAWITNGDEIYQVSTADYNTNQGWKCIVARTQFVEKFKWQGNEDQRTVFWRTAEHGFDINNVGFGGQDVFGHGFLCPKYTNKLLDEYGGELDTPDNFSNNTHCNADFSVIRLAEIYLSAAEAIVRQGGDRSLALEYVNNIRNRAMIDEWTDNDLNLDNILDERCRELFQENVRRSDLVRFGKYTGSDYLWNGKNGTIPGSPIPSHLNLYPLPQTVVALTGYKQNPDY